MIDIKELRIGNYVNTPDGAEEWTHSHFYRLLECTLQEEDISPIVLNEHWLLSFGFEKREGNYYMLRFILEHGISKYFDNGLSFRITIDNSTSAHVASVKYVHQLKNLYYAITGQELIYNELSPKQNEPNNN